ncbi:hypothetical protein BH11ACT6_BH11ACT6_02270 [soil metagenome]
MGERLRERRKDLGLSLSETARRASISPSYLSAVESASSTPSLPVLSRISHALDLTMGEVIAMDERDTVRLDHLDPTPGAKVVSSPQLQMKIVFEVAEPNNSGTCPVTTCDCDVVVFVKTGSLTVNVNGQLWTLGEGDALRSPGSAEMTWRTEASGATAVWASTPRFTD